MLIELNNEITECLSKTELEIVRFINENEERMPKLSIVEIAFDTFTSPSTVSRAIRKCGLNGFNELRYRLTVKAEEKDIQNMGEVMNKSLIEAQRVIEQISVSGILEIIQYLKEASRILFSTYDVDKFIESLCPVHDRVFYEGYAPYWIEHCDVYNEEGKQTHGGGEFSAWNHIIDMGWIEEYGVWKKKDEMCWMIMLPPTMELIQKEYEEAKKRYAGAL